MQAKTFLVWSWLALLAGCGGGGGSPGTCMASAATCARISGSNPNPVASAAVPTGVFRGSSGDGRSLALIILESGDIWLMYTAPGSTTRMAGAQEGHGVFSNGSFSSTDPRDFNVERHAVSAGGLSGAYVERSNVNGTAALGQVTVPIVASYDLSSSLPASLATIAGGYSGTVSSLAGTDNASFTIADDGSLTGTSQLGCRFSGTLTPQPSLNAYAVAITFQGGTCPAENAAVAGVASFEPGLRRLSAAALTADRSNGFVFAGTNSR